MQTRKIKIDYEKLGTDFLKNVIAMKYITCLLPTQNLKGIHSGTLSKIMSPYKSHHYDLKVNLSDEQANSLSNQFQLKYF